MNENIRSFKSLNIKITKSFIEWLITIIIFMFSLINSTTLLISILLMLILLKQKEIGCIKILNIITLRGIISPGIAVGITRYQNIKWFILFGCSIYLLFSYFKLSNNEQIKIRKLINPIILFIIYNILIAFIFSSLPTISIFKLLSYSIIFIGIIIGIGYTYKKINWIEWMSTMLLLVMISSLPFIKLAVGYLRNGNSFQGITNQPNMFGIVISILVALILTKVQFKGRRNLFNYTSIILAIYLVYISKSRTAMITILFLIFMYLIASNIKNVYKMFYINIIGIITVIFFYFDNSVINTFKIFLSKGQNDNILHSRLNQANNLIDNFTTNPWFGNGFSVPVLPFRSYEFSFEYVLEPGNLILGVLSYSGIIGFIIFSYYMFNIFNINKYEFKNIGFLFIGPILISMGEMVFFSSNNIGIFCYMMIGIYIFYNTRDKKNKCDRKNI